MKSKLWLLMLGNLVMGSGSLVIAGILSPIATTLHVSVASAGQLMTAYALAFALGAPTVAVLLGHWDRKRMLLVAMAVFAAASLIGAVATSFAWLLASRILAGVAAAMFSPNAAAVAALLSTPEQRGRAIALVFGGFTLATVFGVPLGAWMGLHIGWRETLTVMGVASALMAVWLWRSLPSGLQLPAVSLAGWRTLVQDHSVRLLLAVSALQIAGTYTVFSFIGPYLSHEIHSSPDQIALLLMLFGLAGFAGNWVSGRAIDRFGPAQVVLMNLLIVMSGLLLMALSHHAAAWMIVGVALWGGAVFSIGTAQQARLIASRPQMTAALLPLNSSFLFAGQSIGGLSGGMLLSLMPGAFAALPWLGIAFVIAAVVISVAAQRTPKTSSGLGNGQNTGLSSPLTAQSRP